MSQDYHCLALRVSGGLTFEAFAGGSVETVTLGTGPWYLLGDGSASDLIQELETQLNGIPDGTWTVDLTTGPSTDAAPVITITCTEDFTLESGTLDLSELGITDRTTPLGADLTSSGHIPILWVPDAQALEFEPEDNAVGSQERTVSNQVYNYSRSEVAEDRVLAWEYMSKARTVNIDSSDTAESLASFWALSRKGRDFQVRVGELASYPGTLAGTYHFANISNFRPFRVSPGVPLYSIRMELLESP